MHHVEDQPRGRIANAISNAIVRIVSEYTGRGPTKAKTVISRDAVLVLMADTLTKAERALIAAGKTDMVLQVRQEFQRTMREDFIAAVEMNMERKVIAFMSDNHIDPEMAAEVFVLEPLPAGEDGKSEATDG
jgi:uncharacterized protein YbcI